MTYNSFNLDIYICEKDIRLHSLLVNPFCFTKALRLPICNKKFKRLVENHCYNDKNVLYSYLTT